MAEDETSCPCPCGDSHGCAPEKTSDDGPPRDADSSASIMAYPNGPLIVRGDVPIQHADGTEIPRSRRTVALCRCGLSSIKPWCDGTHKAAGFRTEDPN